MLLWSFLLALDLLPTPFTPPARAQIESKPGPGLSSGPSGTKMGQRWTQRALVRSYSDFSQKWMTCVTSIRLIEFQLNYVIQYLISDIQKPICLRNLLQNLKYGDAKYIDHWLTLQ